VRSQNTAISSGVGFRKGNVCTILSWLPRVRRQLLRLDGSEMPIDLTDDLGLILGDLDYRPDATGTPRFFHAELINGVLSVPQDAVYGRREDL